MLALANFLTTPNCGAKQNHLIRTNRTPLARKGYPFAAHVYLPPRKSYPFAANVYPQDELRGANKDAFFAGKKFELLGVFAVALFALKKVSLARRFAENSSGSMGSPCPCALCVKFLITCYASGSRSTSAVCAHNSRRMCTYDFAKPNSFVMNTYIKNMGGDMLSGCKIRARNITELLGNSRFHYTGIGRVVFHYASPLADVSACSRLFDFRLSTIDWPQLPQNAHLRKWPPGGHRRVFNKLRGWAPLGRARAFHVAPRPSARHSAFLMLSSRRPAADPNTHLRVFGVLSPRDLLLVFTGAAKVARQCHIAIRGRTS